MDLAAALKDASPEALIAALKAKTGGAAAPANDGKKYVYYFSPKGAEGCAAMRNELGGKGANLAEMASIGLPVPPGFTISAEMCDIIDSTGGEYPQNVKDQVAANLARLEKETGKKFGDNANPLLVSVRSGASVSLPGMMDTVLNLGMNDIAVEGLATKTQNARFAWDSYRRFIAMFSNVVKGCSGEDFEHVLETIKRKKAVESDTQLDTEDLKWVVNQYKSVYKRETGEPFPQEPTAQLWAAIDAVFGSWNNPRAIKYRKINDIKGVMGTAVNVQSMVFGNTGDTSATGVCFSRNPSTGENTFYGEWLVNAQGEDVVAGIRTPQQITKESSQHWAKEHGISEEDRIAKYPSMEEGMPATFKELVRVKDLLQYHYRDMQDMEFTIEDNNLYMLQTRSGKRTALAAVKIAVDMAAEGLIEDKEAVMRISDPRQLDQLLHPMIDPKIKLKALAKGLPASPGAGVGQIVFNSEDAEEWAKQGKKVILVRVETSPEDVGGMHVAQGILTARGGMTSHAAVVARGMGKCCVCGVGELTLDPAAGTCTIGKVTLEEGDWITLNGNTGEVVEGQTPLVECALTGDFKKLMDMCDKYRRLRVRANADTPQDCKVAVRFGAEGVGLCRTEHMFFTGNRIDAVREMIVADNLDQRLVALDKLLQMQREDFVGIFTEMRGRPVTVRLLDPPLHEFVPHQSDGPEAKLLATALKISLEKVKARIESLEESNPMLGHRGCRLGITYPEIYNMQVRAVFEAACQVKKAGIPIQAPEIMIPLVGKVDELKILKDYAIAEAEAVMKEQSCTLKYMIGTMIEVPRAAVTADTIAKEAEFFSFGTNDLTQMGCGFSRDDAGKFLGEYVQKGIYETDPFQSIDQEGVGELVKIACSKGRSVRPKIKLGICGEHGGDPDSIHFFNSIPLTYVSCSPYRVPIAMLAAAQAAIIAEQ
jgi:pyruvate,orthophosphate dikinase